MIKKSLSETALAAPLVKAAAALKFVKFSTVPVASLAILVIVAPASVLVKVVNEPPLASDKVKVTVPAERDPRAVPTVPRVALKPLTVAPDSVATFELTVTLKR